MEYSAITGEFRVVIDGQESTFPDSFFQTCQRQANVNVEVGSSGAVASPYISIPSASQQKQDTTSYALWSRTTQDDPYELTRCAQISTKSRKPFDNADCDGETDLQGLVSNILDEADSHDSHSSEGTIPTCNPFWSPKTLREELLQYFQSEAKMQHNPSFTPNHVSQESFSKVQQLSADKDVEELMKQSSGLASNQQWLFNGDIYTPHSQKLPTNGLPISNTGSMYPSEMQQNKHVSMPSYNNRGYGQPFNNFRDISDNCRPQSEIITPCFESFYEDNYIQGNGMPVGNEQYVPEDMNCSFQSFKAHGNDGIYYGDLTNMQKQVVDMHHEDNTVEQWKITSPTISKQSPGMQIPKQLGELGTVQRKRTKGVRKQTFKYDGFQELPDFYPQCAENVLKPKQFSALLNIPNQYHNKIMHRENVNVSANQYSKPHIQHSWLQNKTKPQVQKEKKKMQASGFQREGFTRRPQFSTHMREGDAQFFSQNPYFDFQENMQFKRFDRENGMIAAGNVQQFMPFMYPINDPRMYSGMPINSNFSSRFPVPYASSVPGMDVSDVMSSNESAAFSSYHSDMRTHRGENIYHGMTSSMLMNHGGPVIQLYFHLDDCNVQWRCLEKERERTEVILTKTFLDKRTPRVTNSNLHKTLPNPTRVDHLIVNLTREQAMVANLLDRMECLCGIPLPKDIHAALSRHHVAIRITQARFNKDIVNKNQLQRPHFRKDRDTILVNMALKDLVTTTRELRTALWCALQMTLTKPIKTQDLHINKEDANKERCPSPFEGYSFKL